MKTSIGRTTPCGDTIFCDDIRYEVTGKTTVVGTYASVMLVPVPFPNKVRLAFRVTYQEHQGESEEPLQLQIYIPGNKLGEPHINLDIPKEMGRDQQPTLGLTPPDDFGENPDTLLNMVLNVPQQEIPMESPGRIRVRMKRGDVFVRLGSIEVVRAPMPEPQQASA